MEEKKNEEEKQVKKRKTKAKEGFTITLDDGSMIDLDSYGWEESLTQKEKLFVFWYTYPHSDSFHNSAKSARKAGYSQKTARIGGYNLKKKEKISKLIEKINNEVVKSSIEEAYHRILQKKIIRAEFDAVDFHDFEQSESEQLGRYVKVTIKPPEKLTREQRVCIDGISIDRNGLPNYKLPDRKEEEKEIIKIYDRLNNAGGENYEVETTAEIIKGNLQVKTKVIKANKEIIESSDLSSRVEDGREEED